MRNVTFPGLDCKAIFKTIVDNSIPLEKRARLQEVIPTVSTAVDLYTELAPKGRLGEIAQTGEEVQNVSADELYNLYTSQFHTGKVWYQDLMDGSLDRICPYCAMGIVKTLDHFLPRSKFQIYSIIARNLVPSCSDCNQIKGGKKDFPDHRFLHPYFEPISSTRWLYAEVVQTNPVTVYFKSMTAEISPPTLAARIAFQFENLSLGERYSFAAGDELSSIKWYLQDLALTSGKQALIGHLQRIAESAKRHDPNSYRLAMFEALAADDWFCETGLFT